MYLAHVTQETDTGIIDTGALFNKLEDLIGESFGSQIDRIIDFTVHGNTYEERKECVYQVAIAYSCGQYPDLSYGELAIIDDWFRTNGERYGLLDEFESECIC